MLAFHSNITLHFFRLGAHTAAIGALLSGFRTALSMKTSSLWAAFIFIALGGAWGLYSAKHWLDMLPLLGFSIGTYAMFCLQGIKMRIALLLGASCWLANNIVVGSIGGCQLELTLISVNCLTIYRLRKG